jgi:NADH-quinone oxidoreductase subunit C
VTADELTGLITARFGPGAISEVSDAGGVSVTVDVPSHGWLGALTFARGELGCDVLDWLSAIDEFPDGLAIVAHVFSRAGGHHLLVRTRVGPAEPHLPTAIPVYGAAAGHERETMQTSGVAFDGHPDRAAPLLPGGFQAQRA